MFNTKGNFLLAEIKSTKCHLTKWHLTKSSNLQQIQVEMHTETIIYECIRLKRDDLSERIKELETNQEHKHRCRMKKRLIQLT